MSLKFSFNGNLLADTHQLGPDDRFSYEAAEADIEITGIIYRTEEIDYLAGSDQYALVIEGNPLLQDNHEAVLNVLFDRLGGFKYRPFRFEVLFYPHLWPGDKITKLIEPDGSEISSIITNHLLKLNANSTLEARGETEAVRGYATGAPFTPSQKRILQTVARTVAEAESSRQTSSLEQAVLRLNELMTNSLGFYSTTVEQAGGGKVVYTHDRPQLEESQVIWTWTEQGFAWTDEGWNGGDPVWQYGVTADGSAIVKLLDAVGIRAEWIQVGSAGDYISGEIDDARDHASTLLQSLADGTYTGGTFIDGKSVISPTVVGLQGTFAELMAGDPFGARLEMGEDAGDPFLEMYSSSTRRRLRLLKDKLQFYTPTGAHAGYISGGVNDDNEPAVVVDGMLYINVPSAGTVDVYDRLLNLWVRASSSTITDYGTTASGSYVRWSNGLQICWGLNTFPGDGWSGSGDKRYLLGQSLAFPTAFDSTPIFLGTTQDSSIALRSAKLANFTTTTSGVTGIAFNGWGTSSSNFYLRWLAIGWWK